MSITVEELVSREVICCVSGLVSDLLTILPDVPGRTLRETSLDYDELLDLTGIDDWEEPVEWYIDHNMDREALVEALGENCVDDERSDDQKRLDILAAGGELPEDPDDIEDWAGVLEVDLRTKLLAYLTEEGELKEFANDRDIEPYRRDVYEHWVVSDWLAARLKEKGECVGDVGNLTVWGRTTTGQMISMDWVIGSIHEDLVA